MKQVLVIAMFFSQIIWAQEELKHEVFFKTDAYDVSVPEQARLLTFLSQIESLDIEKISIYGFTDDRGSADYNMTLSQNRANSIKVIFSDNEFDESVITNVDGKGKILLKVVQEENVSKIRSLNRKVEIIVTPVFPPKPEVVTMPKTASETLAGDIKIGDHILLDNILFKTSYSYLLPESVKTLEEISKILLKRTDIYFTIQGHVCCTQNSRDAYDRKTKKQNLSVARAKYIYDYLAKKGIDPKRMKYVGMRRKFPLGGEAKYDRRVEILVTYVKENNDTSEAN
ncbi:MAG TPA: OmpA family protein [Gelidibacter sp.]|uniref:OmpA family protein n=1 Tax=Gelidibacter sp. TaxID=2018083 RepID=UPI002BB5B267|nr:OmpA family protein [Gelidibacter sp.]HXJ98921.1 OmpA family protein [Gelidibacter sp.]